jgi:hypothetical protein
MALGGQDDAIAWQQSQIQNFSANMPSYQQSQFAGIQDNAQSGLQSDYNKINQNYSARGLLYSGIKDQDRANAAAARGSQAANQEATANTNLNNMNYQNQQAGLNTGYSNYAGQQAQSVAQAQSQEQQNAAQSGMIGQAITGAGMVGALAFSDKNSKENIESGDKDIESFLDKIPSKKYDYKDEKHGEGKQYGLLAQDLEKHPVGKAMVIETPEGKAVDYAKGLATILATQSFLHKKMNDLKSKGKAS